jgi:hypothetical protein
MSIRVVTVFGGTGFLGRRVVRHLREHEFSVRIASQHPDRSRKLFGFNFLTQRGRRRRAGRRSFATTRRRSRIDLFVVPTLTFERLFAFLVLGHGRRQLLWFEVTRHPTAEWLARQITTPILSGLHHRYVRI